MLNFYCCFIGCSGYVQYTTIVEEKIKGCVIFWSHRKVRFNGWCKNAYNKRWSHVKILLSKKESSQQQDDNNQEDDTNNHGDDNDDG